MPGQFWALIVDVGSIPILVVSVGLILGLTIGAGRFWALTACVRLVLLLTANVESILGFDC